MTGDWQSADFWITLYKFTPLLLFLTAIIPRLAALGRYVTPDEPSWVFRSLRFREAVLAADWANTLQSGHPGVTTTWLGSLAIQLQLWLEPASRSHLDWINKLYWLTPDNGAAIRHLAHFLNPARLSVILVTSLGVVAVFLLARDRLGPVTALIGAFLLALDPFLVGLSGLLHLDALLATFMIVTILLLMPRNDPNLEQGSQNTLPVSKRYWTIAGVTTALAILTKSPGLFLLLVIPAIWLWQIVRNEKNIDPWYLTIGLWVISMAVVLLLLLPAIWADPRNTFATISGLTERLLVDAVRPTYFLGESTLRPGFIFYPLAVAYRLSPVVSLGLILAVVGLVYRIIRKNVASIPVTLWWLILFSLAFTLFLNFSAKRFDRYALPAIYALILVAGWGLATFMDYLRSLGRHYLTTLFTLFILTLSLVYLVSVYPFPLTAYNWFLGGPTSAQKVLPVDWGEGASMAAKQAASLPGSFDQILFSTNLPASAPFYPGPLLQLNQENLARARPGDLVIYDASNWQSDPAFFSFDTENDAPIPTSLTGWTVLNSFNFSGLPRSVLLSVGDLQDSSVEPLSERSVGLSFNHNVQLISATILPAASPFRVQVISMWKLDRAEDYQLLLELIDEFGHVRASRELPLLNDVDHLARHWPPGEIQSVYHEMPLPAELPPGPYALTATLFNQEGSRQGVFDPAGNFHGSSATVAEFELKAPDEQPPITIPSPLETDNELAGYDTLPESIGEGEPLTLDLWWKSSNTGTSSSRLALLLAEEIILSDNHLPAGKPGQTYHIRPEWRIPADLAPGSYPLAIQFVDANGNSIWAESIVLGQIEVEDRQRLFELNSDLDPLKVRMGLITTLQQATATLEGDQVLVMVTWQAVLPDGQNYTTFVHLVDAAGNIVAQVDRPPVEPTELWLPDQVVSDRFRLPTPGDGRYTIAIGLYQAGSGDRLPVYGPDGAPWSGDSYELELTIP